LRSGREIWTALILWKINLRAAKSWFNSPSSEKVKVSPSNFLAAIFRSQMSFSLSAWKILIGQSKEGEFVGDNLSFFQSFQTFKFSARMLIGNFYKSLVWSEAAGLLFKNGNVGSFFACITKPIVINAYVEPLFMIRSWILSQSCKRSVFGRGLLENLPFNLKRKFHSWFVGFNRVQS